MAVIEASASGRLRPEEAEAGLALSQEASWNQVAADWRHFARAGQVFVRRAAGRVVASAAALPYGVFGWVSLVLVTPAWRRRGLATGLVAACLRQADDEGWQACLDATPDGAPVYVRLGFQPIDELLRLRRKPAGAPDASAKGLAPEATDAAELERLIAADRAAFGADRRGLLRDIAARPGTRLYRTGGASCLVRPGRVARHIGPVAATSLAEAEALLDRVSEAEPGETVIDLFARHRELRAHLERRGFAAERPFLRMARGPGRTKDDGTAVASAGPEYG